MSKRLDTSSGRTPGWVRLHYRSDFTFSCHFVSVISKLIKHLFFSLVVFSVQIGDDADSRCFCLWFEIWMSSETETNQQASKQSSKIWVPVHQLSHVKIFWPKTAWFFCLWQSLFAISKRSNQKLCHDMAVLILAVNTAFLQTQHFCKHQKLKVALDSWESSKCPIPGCDHQTWRYNMENHVKINTTLTLSWKNLAPNTSFQSACLHTCWGEKSQKFLLFWKQTFSFEREIAKVLSMASIPKKDLAKLAKNYGAEWVTTFGNNFEDKEKLSLNCFKCLTSKFPETLKMLVGKNKKRQWMLNASEVEKELKKEAGKGGRPRKRRRKQK